MRTSILMLLATLTATACSPTVASFPYPTASAVPDGTQTVPSPTPPPPTPRTITTNANYVSSDWLTGSSGGTLPQAPVLSCSDYGSWVLRQFGQAVSGSRALWLSGGTMSIKLSPPPAPTHLEVVSGTNEQGHLHMRGTLTRIGDLSASDAATVPVVYDLTYESETHTLRGTRNGEPFWAVPMVPGKTYWSRGNGAPPECL